MNDPHFFGYGSLVNRNTHAYPDLTPAKVRGWRRTWAPSPFRPVAFLSVVPAPGEWVLGALARVPNADWNALDKREAAYARHHVEVDDCDDHRPGLQIYAAEDLKDPSNSHPILLSYLDVVVQGFLREHGKRAAEDFFSTTDGWETPVLNDRNSPRYPRHQSLTQVETDIVDSCLRNLSAMVDDFL